MRSHKYTLTDVLAMLAMLFVAIALVIPSIAKQRSLARQTQCASNLKQIGLAIHNYSAAFNQLPRGLAGTVGGTDADSNQERLGPLIAILPFMEEQPMWEDIANPFVGARTGKRFQAMGPAPWYDPDDYTPWSNAPGKYRCPESVDAVEPADEPSPTIVTTLVMPPRGSVPGMMPSGNVASNYVGCWGDGTQRQGELAKLNDNQAAMRQRASMRGIFAGNRRMKFRDVLDGLNNTVLYCEAVSVADKDSSKSRIVNNIVGLAANPGLCLAAADGSNPQWSDIGRGQRWNDGALAISGFQTVLPPNAPSCLSELGIDEPLVSASSHHEGGVFVLMGSGAVTFVSDTIDCGNSNAPGVAIDDGFTPPGSSSPYGVWGAMGSRANKESLELSPENGIEPIELLPDRNRRNSRRHEDQQSVWTDSTGKLKLSAKFIRIIDRKTVELEDARKILYRVPLNTLSDADIYRAAMMSLTQ